MIWSEDLGVAHSSTVQLGEDRVEPLRVFVEKSERSNCGVIFCGYDDRRIDSSGAHDGFLLKTGLQLTIIGWNVDAGACRANSSHWAPPVGGGVFSSS